MSGCLRSETHAIDRFLRSAIAPAQSSRSQCGEMQQLWRQCREATLVPGRQRSPAASLETKLTIMTNCAHGFQCTHVRSLPNVSTARQHHARQSFRQWRHLTAFHLPRADGTSLLHVQRMPLLGHSGFPPPQKASEMHSRVGAASCGGRALHNAAHCSRPQPRHERPQLLEAAVQRVWHSVQQLARCSQFCKRQHA